MSKVYDIAFRIAGKLSSQFTGSFKNAEKTVGVFNQSLKALNAGAASMEGLIKLREQVSTNARSVIDATKKFKGMQAQSDRLNARTETLSRQYASAKRSVTVYANQISKCGVPTRELAEKFARASEKAKALEAELEVASRESKSFAVQTNEAKNALERARAALDRNRSSLREMDSQMGTTGTKMQTLIERQNNLAKAADRARQAQERLAKVQGLQDKVSSAQASSTGALMGIGATVAATAGAPVKQAMNFEDQQAELRKFSDEYKEVFAGIQDLSLKYAKSTGDMTAMASNAFQSGIAKTGEEALKLIEIQNQMAIAFDMTGDEVGSSFADIQSKMGMTIDQSQEVFDIVNQIGNTTSAKSKDVVEVLQRSGGALAGLTKMSGKQIAALAGAFRSASVSSETAATSMQSFINTLTSGSGATKGQREAFSKLNIDAEKLAKAMTKSPESAQKAIQDVLARLGKLPKAEQSPMIGALFGNDAGIKAAVATLVDKQHFVGDNFKLISDPANYAGSMLKEFQARADTTSNSLEIMQNAIKLVAGGIGTALLPAVRKSAESFVANSKAVITWVNQNQELILSAMKVAGAVVGAAAGFHVLRLGLTFIASPVLSLYKGFLQVHKAAIFMKTAIMMAGGPMKALTIGVRAFGTAMKGLFLNPVGLAILAATALVAAGVAIYKNWDAIKAKAVELWAIFAEKFPNIAALGQLLWTGLKYAFDGISSVFQSAWSGLQFLGSVFSTSFSIMVNAAKVFLGGIVDVFANVAGIFDNIIGLVKNVFTGQWSAAWDNVKGIFSNVFGALAGIAKAPINAVIALVNGAIGAINGISVDIPDWVPKFGGEKFGVNLPTIPQLAEGGIATRSTLANIGEGGEPEAVIPLSKLSSMLGAGVGIGGGITVNFAPVINVSGGSGDAYADMMRGLDEGRRQLEKDLRRILADQRRTSFA
jgi:TP901 family phage tail tape measure protein